MVGAIVLDAGGAVVGRGFHERFGGPHAEVNALREAGERAKGGTLYVTLEPCCHHGKTPPCTDAIVTAGIVRVVAAMEDPFPLVAGGGGAALRNAGITVEVGLLQDNAARMNAPYLKLLRTGLPWVHLKWAMTLDGRIATTSGESKWITGPESRAKVHEIRGGMDAILVGRGTVLADDPQLTARPPGPRTPVRVVVSATGELPTDCQLRRTAKETPVIVYTANVERLKGWAADGAEIIRAPSLESILKDLGKRCFTNVLVEGGAGLLGSFFDADAFDEVHAFIAPKLVGGSAAPGPLGGVGLDTIAGAITIGAMTTESLGSDFYLHGLAAARH